MSESDLLVARSSGRVMVREGGRQRYLSVQRGMTVARKGHPIVEADPKMWQPLRVHYDLPAGRGGVVSNPATATRPPRAVEQATAAPGELRAPAPAQQQETYACDEPGCDATAKSPAGLAAHKRSHRGHDE